MHGNQNLFPDLLPRVLVHNLVSERHIGERPSHVNGEVVTGVVVFSLACELRLNQQRRCGERVQRKSPMGEAESMRRACREGGHEMRGFCQVLSMFNGTEVERERDSWACLLPCCSDPLGHALGTNNRVRRHARA